MFKSSRLVGRLFGIPLALQRCYGLYVMLEAWNKTGVRPAISVYLDNTNSEEKKEFHCVVCGKVCFEYYNNVRIMIPGAPDEKYWKAPLKVQCNRRPDRWDRTDLRSGSCKTIYYIMN